jgi:hypothetical protein
LAASVVEYLFRSRHRREKLLHGIKSATLINIILEVLHVSRRVTVVIELLLALKCFGCNFDIGALPSMPLINKDSILSHARVVAHGMFVLETFKV